MKKHLENFTNPMENNESKYILKPTDRLLPIANISKIMKRTIPKLAKVSKESKELMQLCASEFIAIITARAKDICEIEARKAITGDDLIRAMEDLDMPYYAEVTKMYYDQYKRLIEEEKRKTSANCMN